MEIRKSRRKALNNLYQQLEMWEVETEMYKLARPSQKKGKDFNQAKNINENPQQVLTWDNKIKKERWK